MKITEIMAYPTTYDTTPLSSPIKIHESLLRSYHILNKVEELLRAGTPAPVVLDLIAEMRDIGRDGSPQNGALP